jgi:dihydrofolate reductase
MALAELGLIDEYEFVVQPRLAGHGPTLFARRSKRLDLKLVSLRPARFVPFAGPTRCRCDTRLSVEFYESRKRAASGRRGGMPRVPTSRRVLTK